MQNVNFSHHQTAKNSWTSGGIATCYVGCGCTMYLPVATSGARYDLPPPPPGAMSPVPGAHHYILCVHEKMRRVFFMHGCLCAYDVAIATLPRFCTDSWTLPKNSILGIVVHKIKKGCINHRQAVKHFCLTVFYCYLLSLSSPAFLFLSAVVQAVCFILHLIGLYGMLSLCIWSKHHIGPICPPWNYTFNCPSGALIAFQAGFCPICL